MKNGWNLCTLGNTFATVTGTTPSKSKTEFYGDNIPFVKPPELLDSQVENSQDSLSEEGRRVARIAPSGSILISCIGNLGKIGIATRDVAFNQQINAILPDQSKAHPKFMFYQALSPLFRSQLDSLATGTTVSIVNKSRFNSIDVVLPPLDEQKRIVSILDQAFKGLDRARANAEANLESAREMFDSSVEQLINPPDGTFEERRFGDLLDFLNGHAFKSGDSVRASNVQVLRMGNLYRNQLDIDRGAVFYPENFKTQYEKYALKAGDVVLTLTGTSGKKDYGFAVEIPVVQRTLLLNQRIAKLIVVDHNRIDLSFMVFQLRSKSFLDRLYSSANGTRQANLSTAAIKEFMIKVPPMQKQKEIASKLLDLSQNIDEMKTGLETKLNDLMQLRESLLQKAFSGELT